MRRDKDYYSTPAWCVEWFLDRVVLPPGVWLEPSAGSGAIARAVPASQQPSRWVLVEIDPVRANGLKQNFQTGVVQADFLRTDDPWLAQANVVLGNPPYSHALGFIRRAMELPRVTDVAFLLRGDFMSSQKRARFFSEYCPDLYILSKRPSFGGGNDLYSYAWFHWRRTRVPGAHWERPSGTVRVVRAPGSGELF
jgi:hypothetical protein